MPLSSFSLWLKKNVVLLYGAVWLGAQAANAVPVVVTVTPAAVSNTYNGAITLNITGLTNSEPVTVQKWLDLNGNGFIDANEPLMDAFKITDNDTTSMLIGGVTNYNVPRDSSAVGGEISTSLGVAAILSLENLVGKYIYRVVSPSQRFSPATSTFAVTNAVLSQSVSGIIYSNGVPLPNGVVAAQDQQVNQVTGAAVADNTGHYFLTLPAGSYSLIAFAPNCYFDESQAPSITLTNGIAATNALFLTNGTVTLAGNVYDATNNKTLGGALVQLESGALFAVAFTDTNGNYSAAVTPSFWKVKPMKERLARRGYVVPNATFQVNTTTNSVTNANFALPRGNALFYGHISDNSNISYSNIRFDASDAGNNFSAKGYSDANGDYAVAVLGGITDQWNCNVNSGKDTALADYVLNVFDSATISSNQTVLQNFVALPATARISGHVQDNSGSTVTGVTLNAVGSLSGRTYQSLDATTDNAGNYSLAVATGTTWNVQFLTGGSSDNLDTKGYIDLLAPHNVTIPPTNVVLNLTVYPIGTPIISQSQRFSSTQFGFAVNGASNVSYTVQVSTNLTATNWPTLVSFVMTNNAPFPVVDTQATNTYRFYRVQKN